MLALKMYFRMHALVNSIYNDSSNQIIQSINIIQHNIGYNKKSISDINNSNIIIADQGQVLSWFSLLHSSYQSAWMPGELLTLFVLESTIYFPILHYLPKRKKYNL